MSTSSADWLFNIKRFYPNTFLRLIQSLTSEFNSKVTDDSSNLQGEELQEETIGGLGETRLKFCDDDFAHIDEITPAMLSNYSMWAAEPDFNTCKCMVEFNSIGGNIPDRSGFNHTAKLYGINRIHQGILYAPGNRSFEVVFDGRSNYAVIADHSDFTINNTPFSFFIRILPFALDNTANARQTVLSKKDSSDATGNKWFKVEIGSDGSVYFILSKDANNSISITTPPNVISAVAYDNITINTPRYDIAVIYNSSINSPLLYVNGNVFSSSSATMPVNTQAPTVSGYDVNFGRYAEVVTPPAGEKYAFRQDAKLYYGLIQGFKWFKNRLLTNTEITNHYTNKVTTASIPWGQVAMPDCLFVPGP